MTNPRREEMAAQLPTLPANHQPLSTAFSHYCLLFLAFSNWFRWVASR